MPQRQTQNSRPQTLAPRTRRGSGFTLMELLVVVAIMILLFTIAVPSVRNLLNSGRISEASALMSSASASLRVYADQSPPFPVGSYQGVALLFTPSNEIRYVQHTYAAKDSSNNFIIQNGEGGYADLDREYLQLPAGVGVVGISMGAQSSAPYVYMLPPPFAVRFNPNGHLIARRSATTGTPPTPTYGTIFYDHDYDFVYSEISLPRSATYDPAPYDPDSPDYNVSNFDQAESPARNAQDTQKHFLPFDEIETVIGVMIYDKAEFASAGHSLKAVAAGGRIDDNARQWLLDNGEPLFFNRYNGSRIRP